MLRLAAVAFFLSVHAVFGPIGYLAAAIASVMPLPRKPLHRLTRAIMHRAFRAMHFAARLCALVEFRPDRAPGDLPEGPALVIANHPTLMDVTVMMAAYPQMTTWVKPAIYRRWWMRPILRCAGFFPSADSYLDARRVHDDLLRRFADREHVLVFPEGTRSPAGSMGRFGRLAFAAAVEAGVPIIPVVIHCEPRWLTRERGFADLPNRPPRFTLEMLGPVDTTTAGVSSRAIRDTVDARVRARVTRALQ